MPTDADPTDDGTSDESTTEWRGFERRPLLKALGGAGALSLLGSAGAAAQETTTQRGGDSPLHPVFGQALAAGEAVPSGIDPVHVVELDVVEEDVHSGFPLRPDPENPDQMVESKEEFLFDPVGLHVAPGDVVQFESLAHLHTVTAFHEKFGQEMHPMPTRVPDGVPGFTSPLFVKDESWLYEFSEPGVYDMLCLPHFFFGMVTRIVVSDEGEDVEAPAAPSEAVPPNAGAVLTASELDPQNIVENGTVAWSDLTLQMGTPTETTTNSG